MAKKKHPVGSQKQKKVPKALKTVKDVTDIVEKEAIKKTRSFEDNDIYKTEMPDSWKEALSMERVITRAGAFGVPKASSFPTKFSMSGHRLLQTSPIEYYDKELDLEGSFLKSRINVPKDDGDPEEPSKLEVLQKAYDELSSRIEDLDTAGEGDAA